MNVKMSFSEIMNLHILIEKCMLWLSTKKLDSSSSELQNICVSKWEDFRLQGGQYRPVFEGLFSF